MMLSGIDPGFIGDEEQESKLSLRSASRHSSDCVDSSESFSL